MTHQQDRETTDPNRVGGPSNHLLGTDLSTVIARPTKGATALSSTLERLHQRSDSGDRALVAAFRKIGHLCDELGLNAAIKDTACELYKKVSASRSAKGRNTSAACAAITFIACRQESHPRAPLSITLIN